MGGPAGFCRRARVHLDSKSSGSPLHLCQLAFDILGGIRHHSNNVGAYIYRYHFEKIHPLKMRTQLDGWSVELVIHHDLLRSRAGASRPTTAQEGKKKSRWWRPSICCRSRSLFLVGGALVSDELSIAPSVRLVLSAQLGLQLFFS